MRNGGEGKSRCFDYHSGKCENNQGILIHVLGMSPVISLVSLFDSNTNSFLLHFTDATSVRPATECHA